MVGVLLLGPGGCLLPDLEVVPASNGGRSALDASGGSSGSFSGETGGSKSTSNGGKGGSLQGSGGVPVIGSGGVAVTGSGGMLVGSGGVAVPGAGGTPGSGTGGQVTTGGVGSGGSSTGGSGVGGSAPTGGGPATGGSSGTGGRPSTGGSPGTGGKGSGGAATGGSPGTGGGPATGGSPGTGGSSGGPLGDLNALRNACLQTINQYRSMLNPAPSPLVRASASVETCSDSGAASDAATGVAHGSAGNCPGMGSQNTCPGWPVNQSSGVIGAMNSCLAQMWAEGEPPEGRTACINKYFAGDTACFEAHGHYLNMSDPANRLVSCGFAVMTNGRIWMNQDFGK